MINLLFWHRYNTDSQKRERDLKKEENLKKLLKEIKWEFKQDDKNPYDLKWFFEN